MKTELNCLFNISALSFGLSFKIPFSFNGAISIESVFLCFTNVQSFLLLVFVSLSVSSSSSSFRRLL